MYVDRPRVLLVDDEKEVADAYALRIEAVADVTVTYGGAEALSAIDESEPPDVVLLDRHMPERSGDEVLEELREYDMRTRVVMVTAIDPGLELLELPFDDYLCKPVEKRDLVGAIEQQLTATKYDERLTEYLEVTSKLGLLEAEKTAAELDGSEDVDRLRERAAELKADLDETLAEFDDATAAFQEIDRDP